VWLDIRGNEKSAMREEPIEEKAKGSGVRCFNDTSSPGHREQVSKKERVIERVLSPTHEKILAPANHRGLGGKDTQEWNVWGGAIPMH